MPRSAGLRPTSRECIVTSGHVTKNHAIRSDISQNPVLNVNFMALCVIEPGLSPIKVLHCGNRDVRPFCSCDLDLDSMALMGDIPDVQI